MEHLRQVDGGVSRNRKCEVRLPARHSLDPDDGQRGDVEDAGQRRDPRLALVLRPEEGEDGIRDVTLEELGAPVLPILEKPIERLQFAGSRQPTQDFGGDRR